MKKSDKLKLITKTIRIIANILLILSMLFFFVSLYYGGVSVFDDVKFWVILIAMWQAVIMLILTENFYVPKK